MSTAHTLVRTKLTGRTTISRVRTACCAVYASILSLGRRVGRMRGDLSLLLTRSPRTVREANA